MASLIFKRFRCVVDTSEIGDESPYFITWVGNVVTNTSALRYTRQAFWENKVSPGPWWPVNETVASGFDLAPAHSLALTIMIEEDEGTDLTKDEAGANVRSAMSALLSTHFMNHSDIQQASVVDNFKATFEAEVKKILASPTGAQDDLMKHGSARAAQRIALQSAAGTLPLVTFRDDGDGKYQAEFAIGA